MIVYAAFFEATSATCAGIQAIELACCPAPTDAPCALCADGITAREGFVLPDDGKDATTCAEVVNYAVLFEAASEACASIQGMEVLCCPIPADDPCSFCLIIQRFN